MKTKIVISITGFSAALALAGCVSGHQSSLWKPWTWGQGTAAAKVEKAEAAQSTQEAALVDAAQVETVKTQAALLRAEDSRPVEVARRTNDNAVSLLNQRKPLSASAHAEAMDIVRGLLSEETAKREAAEQRQSAMESQNLKLSRELEDTRRALGELAGQAKAEARRNLELANELRRQTWVKWGSVAWAVIATGLAVAWKLNLGGLQSGVANGLAVLQKRYGASDADVKDVKSEIDALIGVASQRSIAARAAQAMAQLPDPSPSTQ
ncbi:hypothetical protein OpiT1DRAFT_05299 [Opitutaceae bacterium TAV1]|nr:hypothetical protein OpiT1DRAFT_05299 [Opitutaceae bacterium TAV1]